MSRKDAGTPAEFVRRGSPVLLYFHGGGFVVGAADMWAVQFCALLRRLEARHGERVAVLSVEYSLGPAARFPAAASEALAAFRWLVDSGVDPSAVVVGGDSAGGNLALSLCLRVRETPGLSQPCGALLVSPWVDLRCTGEASPCSH